MFSMLSLKTGILENLKIAGCVLITSSMVKLSSSAKITLLGVKISDTFILSRFRIFSITSDSCSSITPSSSL